MNINISRRVVTRLSLLASLAVVPLFAAAQGPAAGANPYGL